MEVILAAQNFEMKKFYSLLLLLFTAQFVFAWGQEGHRVVGEVAWNHLTKKAQKNVQKVLGTESLGMCGNYMDFIKSDPTYDSLGVWHYCTIPDGEEYHAHPEEGDVIMAINHYLNELKTKNYSVDETFALKCLVHLVGDIHQPLHVGNGTDRGGNNVKIEFMYQKTNLHRVWDSDLIEFQQLSYSEYTAWVDVATKDQIAAWQSAPILDWANESKAMRPLVYNYPSDGKLGYRYNFDCIAALNERLNQAGIRLAYILNQIYG